VIPGKFPLLGRDPDETSSLIKPDPTIAPLILRNPAGIHAQITQDPIRVFGWNLREPEGGPAFDVRLVSDGEGFLWPFPDAAEACPEFL